MRQSGSNGSMRMSLAIIELLRSLKSFSTLFSVNSSQLVSTTSWGWEAVCCSFDGSGSALNLIRDCSGVRMWP